MGVLKQPKLSSDPKDDIDRWDKGATLYSAFISKGDMFRDQLLHPVISPWVADISGKKVLDAGCGEGFFAKKCADEGAIVHGIDASQELIRIAKKKYADKNVAFSQHDLRDSLSFKDEEFDIVVCNLVLMDFDPIDGAVRELSRVLKPGGGFIFTILHPAFISGELGKSFLEFMRHKPPHYRISQYNTPFKKERNVAGIGVITNYYHRPLEYYFGLLYKNGLQVHDLREPVFEKEFVKDKNNFFKTSSEVPLFLIIRAEKRTTELTTELIQ